MKFTSIVLASIFFSFPSLADEMSNAWESLFFQERQLDNELHSKAEAALTTHFEGARQASFRELELQNVRALLEERSIKKTSSDLRLKFDLGQIYEALNLHDEAISLLNDALTQMPDDPAAEDAWLTLAYAYAKLERTKEERDAYLHFLSINRDFSSRSTATLNFAENQMKQGDLKGALASYAKATDLAAQSRLARETEILAEWGKAVALDRLGETEASVLATERALQIDSFGRLITAGPNVFFVPAYERLYYMGLAEEVMAKLAEREPQTFEPPLLNRPKTTNSAKAKKKGSKGLLSSTSERDEMVNQIRWRRARDIWQAYVKEARSKDRWLRQAKTHLLYCDAKLSKNERTQAESNER